MTPPLPTPTPSPTPHGDPFPTVQYGLNGSALLKTLASGPVPLKGTVTTENPLLTGGSAQGKTVLQPTTAKLRALNVVPITASLRFTEVGSTRATFQPGQLSLTTSQLIRITNAKAFGVSLVSGTCVTATPATIPLKSAAGGFNATIGGTLLGTFTIPAFKSCGALTSLVTGLAAGSGNAISLSATSTR